MAENKMFYYIPRCLLPEILCLTIAMKYQRILVQDVTLQPNHKVIKT